MINKNKWIILIILAVFVSIGTYCLYYYYPRKIAFEFVKEIEKPNKEYDLSQFVGFHYVQNNKDFLFYLAAYNKAQYYKQSNNQDYDSLFVQNLSKELNFDKYDYIMTYQKQLKALTYSPYLAKKEDLMGYLSEKSLIPTFDTVITDKLYIYRIKKNNEYRAPGP